jgi:hypothetical protein
LARTLKGQNGPFLFTVMGNARVATWFIDKLFRCMIDEKILQGQKAVRALYNDILIYQ